MVTTGWAYDVIFVPFNWSPVQIINVIEKYKTHSKSNNTVHAKSLTVTDHGLVMRVLLPSLQCAPETKR